METTASSIFWISIYISAVGIVQWLFVRKTATAGQNRWFIISGTILSIATGIFGNLPVVDLAGSAQGYSYLLPEIVISASSGIETTRLEVYETFSTHRLLLVLSLGVSAILFFRMAAGVIYLFTRIRVNRRILISGCTVLPVQAKISPFSFFGFVFVPQSIIAQKCLGPVLLHEKAHIRKRHSFDLIFIEMLTILLWFNPAIWYLRREIKLQHEFEADMFVIENQVDRLSYQNILMDMTMSGLNIPIINPFNYSPLKRRIMMMNEKFKRGRKRAFLSMFMVIPLFVLLFLVQACDTRQEQEVSTQVEAAEERIKAYEEEVIFTVVEEPPRFSGGESARQHYFGNNLRYPEEARREGIQGTVFVSFVVEKDGSISNVKVLRGIGGGCDEEAVRVAEMMPRWEPGHQRGEPVRVQFSMPVRFRLNSD